MHREREREDAMAFGKQILGQTQRVGPQVLLALCSLSLDVLRFLSLGSVGGQLSLTQAPSPLQLARVGFCFSQLKESYTFPIPSGH